MIERLGIIRNKNGEVLRHRTLIKMLINPIFRKIGYSIVSCFKDNEFIEYQIREYPEHCRVLKN